MLDREPGRELYLVYILLMYSLLQEEIPHLFIEVLQTDMLCPD